MGYGAGGLARPGEESLNLHPPPPFTQARGSQALGQIRPVSLNPGSAQLWVSAASSCCVLPSVSCPLCSSACHLCPSLCLWVSSGFPFLPDSAPQRGSPGGDLLVLSRVLACTLTLSLSLILSLFFQFANSALEFGKDSSRKNLPRPPHSRHLPSPVLPSPTRHPHFPQGPPAMSDPDVPRGPDAPAMWPPCSRGA